MSRCLTHHTTLITPAADNAMACCMGEMSDNTLIKDEISCSMMIPLFGLKPLFSYIKIHYMRSIYAATRKTTRYFYPFIYPHLLYSLLIYDKSQKDTKSFCCLIGISYLNNPCIAIAEKRQMERVKSSSPAPRGDDGKLGLNIKRMDY